MRVQSSIHNTFVGIVAQIVYQLFNFASRTILIKVMGAEYLGLNSLFSNILSLLSIAEMGFSSVILVSMYKPLATGNERKVKAFLRAYRNVYLIIGGLVLVAGIAFIPGLPYIVGDIPTVQFNLTLIYLLILSNTVCGYIFSYKRSIIIASQKKHIDNINNMIFCSIKNILMMLAIILTKNYIIYLAVQPLLLLSENISISRIANKIFPYIKQNKEKLTKEETHELKTNTFSIALHNISDVVVFATDNLLISIFLGVATVGYFSNYQLIVSIVTIVVMMIINQITASVGNLVAESNKENAFLVLKRILFLHFWILGFCSIALMMLTQHFVMIWLGGQYLLPFSICIANVICFYVRYSREPIACFKNATGLFVKDKFFSILKAVINLVISILLLKYWGLIGVIIGTIACILMTNFWIEPILVCKQYFQVSPLKYFGYYAFYTMVTCIAGALTYVCVCFLPSQGIVYFIIKLLICVVVPNLIYLLFYFKMPEFKYLIDLIKKILRRKKNENKAI